MRILVHELHAALDAFLVPLRVCRFPRRTKSVAVPARRHPAHPDFAPVAYTEGPILLSLAIPHPVLNVGHLLPLTHVEGAFGLDRRPAQSPPPLPRPRVRHLRFL